MSEKRRDSKGRILLTGEGQDSNGRYFYRYVDLDKKRRTVYSWKLNATDKLPAGKQDDLSLREKEKEIQRDLEDGICSGNMTVMQLVEEYTRKKNDKVKETTRIGYQTVINILKNEEFSNRRIKDITILDAEDFLEKLQKVDKRGYSTIHNIRGVLRPAFKMAYEGAKIRRNPFDFDLSDYVQNDSKTREALTSEQEQLFLDFVYNDSHFSRYYDGIYILFKTGMRIGEFCGLTIRDVDLNENLVHINHQLRRTMHGYYIETPKTDAGKRDIYFDDDVADCFKHIINNRKNPKIEPMIDGYAGFLYLDKNGMPMIELHWEHYFQHICAKYNKTHEGENIKVTPHICRHTYCTNQAKKGLNTKYLQYLMGHSDYKTTMDVYTHIRPEDVKAEIKRVNNLQKNKSNGNEAAI